MVEMQGGCSTCAKITNDQSIANISKEDLSNMFRMLFAPVGLIRKKLSWVKAPPQRMAPAILCLTQENVLELETTIHSPSPSAIFPLIGLAFELG